jgi:CHASE2 domain-containing sensor protein
MFKKFWLDTILGTLFVLFFLWGISQITAFNIMEVFDPIGDVFADMESTDIVFSQMKEPPTAEEDIVLVNIGELSRGEIGTMVNIINAYNPKVIGIDTFFKFPKEDTLGDLMLSDAFSQVKNLVMVSKLAKLNANNTFDSLELSHPMFSWNSKSAFANFITGASTQEDLKSCRTFTPKEIVNGEYEYALSVQLAMEMDSVKTQKFLDRNNDIEIINYKGNVVDYGATKFGTTYFALDVPDVMYQNFTPDLIEGKCVLFCFLGAYLGDRSTAEDMYFTPLNKKYVGKAHADMFGGVVHANAISMILEENYIDKPSDFATNLIAILLLYINIVVFTYIYKVLPRWYDGLTKLMQLTQALGLFVLVLVVFDWYNYKLDVNIALVFILISGDALEVYFGVVKNIFTKEGRKELTQLNKL